MIRKEIERVAIELPDGMRLECVKMHRAAD